MKYLVDSNIIIYHLNKNEFATKFLKDNYQDIAISQITFIEVLSFPFTIEQEKIVRELLESFQIIDINMDIANQAIKNRQHKKIKIPDNIIASTAMVNNLILVTKNIKDFNFLDIKILDIEI
jgi:predicted nucleic acid-binding protein